MPTYVAFLRAINLGAQRKFPAADIVAATEAAGGTDVQTYLNTGNVRLDSRRRSTESVATALAKAFAKDRGFEVPTIVVTPDELRDVVRTADDLAAEHSPRQVHVVLLSREPSTAAVEAAESLALDDQVVVRGRAAYVLLSGDFHTSRLLSGKEYRALGEGTVRRDTVLRAVEQRWGR